MKFYELELNGRTVKFRLTTNDCMVIEKTFGKSILEYVQGMSMTTIATLIRYMVRSSIPNYSEKDAMTLVDELIDAGYTLSTIIDNIILEALSVSGFMSQEELAEMRAETAEKKKK